MYKGCSPRELRRAITSNADSSNPTPFPPCSLSQLQLLLIMALSSLFNGSVSASACTAASFHYPSILGAEFLSLETTLVSNYSGLAPYTTYINHGNVTLDNVSFCNVTVSYTRVGQNNTIHNQVWLPLNWNGRMQGIGGGGYSAGLNAQNLGFYGSIGEGYASVGTDAGLTGLGGFASPFDASPWAQTSPGNVNLYALQNFGYVALNDAAIVGKSISKDFYGQPPTYSYFSGCSGGGRQAMMLAQRYPDAYDGIVAAAPAIYWPSFFPAMYWPRFVMDQLGVYPHPCEFEIIRDQAVAACDGDDGLVDLIISRPDLCKFDPMTLAGKSYTCTSKGMKWEVSAAAAMIAQKIREGPRKADKTPLWYGFPPGTALTGGFALANTECTASGTCTPVTFPLPLDWIRLFVLKDPNTNLTALTQRDYENIFEDSVQEYSSFLATDKTNLEEFHSRGGKLISWHGIVSAPFPLSVCCNLLTINRTMSL